VYANSVACGAHGRPEACAVTHGTYAGYQHGCRCLACRTAAAAYRMTLRWMHRRGIVPLGTLVSATATWRRIRQLQAERFTRTEIARRLGVQRHGLALHTDRVTLRNALKVQRLCRALLMGRDDG
jgi:hypothetical protein